jgi:hypothetical protein
MTGARVSAKVECLFFYIVDCYEKKMTNLP